MNLSDGDRVVGFVPARDARFRGYVFELTFPLFHFFHFSTSSGLCLHLEFCILHSRPVSRVCIGWRAAA